MRNLKVKIKWLSDNAVIPTYAHKSRSVLMVKKTCPICGTEFSVPLYRKDIAKYCSVGCQRKSLHAQANVVCTNCGNPFHMKKSRQNRFSRNMGYFCSRECLTAYRKVWFCGENNHQFGLKGEKNSSFKGSLTLRKNNRLTETEVYAPERIDSNGRGRVTQHRLLVEENWALFPSEAFEVINGQHVLRKGYEVHHKDFNHSNNDLSNLEVLTKSEHRTIHNLQYQNIRSKDTGRIIRRQRLSASDRGIGGYGSTGK